MGAWQSQSNTFQTEAGLDRALSQPEAESSIPRVLVLGKRGAGVPTVIHTMRVHYGQGVSTEEKISARSTIFQALIVNSKRVVAACGTLADTEPLKNIDSKSAAKILDNSDLAGEVNDLPESIAHAINVLWNDEHIRQVWERRSQFQVWDKWGDFAAKCADFPNWGGRKWVPSLEEYFTSKELTDNGLVVDTFHLYEERWQITHVRGKEMLNNVINWKSHFNDVHGFLYVVNASEYDQGGEKNALEESLDLFDHMCNAKALRDSGIMVLLNKVDLFHEKLCDKKIPLNISGRFPEAPDSFEYAQGIEWLRKEFVNRIRVQDKTIHVQFTMGTSPTTMHALFEMVKESLLMLNGRSSGLF